MSNRNKEIEVPYWISLDDTVEILMKERKMGHHVYCDFNEHRLYSKDISFDKAYMTVYGKTKDEYLKEEKEYQKREEEAKRELEKTKWVEGAIKDIWKQKGKEFICEEKYDMWESYVDASMDGLYKGEDIACTLKILKAFASGANFEDVKNWLQSQKLSGVFYSLVLCEVARLSNQGPEFYVYMHGLENMDTDELKVINNLINDNKRYESMKMTRKTK